MRTPKDHTKTRRTRWFSLAAALMALAAAPSPFTLQAIVVDGVCTLGDAILSANTDTDVGACTGAGGVETIVLDVDTTLTVADTVHSSELDRAFAGLPDVTSEFTIVARAAAVVERDSALDCVAGGANHFRLFNVVGGNLTLDGLTLAGGCAGWGGAIHVSLDGQLSVVRTTLRDHTAQGDVAAEARGGAIFATSSLLNIHDSVFENNLATTPDSGVNVTFAALGGAVALPNSSGPVVITGSRFEGNEASTGDSSLSFAGAGFGGAIWADSGTVFAPMENCTFLGNIARAGSGSSGGFAQGGGDLFESRPLHFRFESSTRIRPWAVTATMPAAPATAAPSSSSGRISPLRSGKVSSSPTTRPSAPTA